MDYREWTENRDSIPTDAVGRDDAKQDVLVPHRRIISIAILFLMLMHRESNVNRGNYMKSLAGYYVNTPEVAFSPGMKNSYCCKDWFYSWFVPDLRQVIFLSFDICT